MPPTATVSEYHSSSKGSTTTTRRSWLTTDSDTTRLSWEDTSRRIRYDLLGGITLHAYVEDSLMGLDPLGLSPGSRALDKALGGIRGDCKMAPH